MESLGFVFGMMGMSMGITGFIFSITVMNRVEKLEGKLKELGVIENDFKSE